MKKAYLTTTALIAFFGLLGILIVLIAGSRFAPRIFRWHAAQQELDSASSAGIIESIEEDLEILEKDYDFDANGESPDLVPPSL